MAPSDAPRAPLGLPPGSVRAILAILTMVQLWILLLLPEDRAIPIPLNLYFLMALVLVFFAAHGKSISTNSGSTPSPLWMPRGSIRFLLAVITIGVVVFISVNYPERFDRRLIPNFTKPEETVYWKYLLAAVFGGIVLGQFTRIFPFKDSYGFQTFKAWASLIAITTMFIEVILQTMVRSSLVKQFDFSGWEVIVTAIVAFYYGVRS